jgi:6-phosphogluconate dehydrogenase (decarboxylating)
MKTHSPTQLGMVGLGRMGTNMVRRLINAGHRCTVFDRIPKAVEDLANEGAAGASSLADLVKQLEKPRAVAAVWRRGSVIASWLLDLTANALAKDPALSKFTGRVSDSGEGRWTIKAAIDEGVPVPVLTTALYERFASRGEADFQDKLLSAMRFGFGGHLEKPAK